MTAIVDILAREILDSRGNPTVEVEVALDSGASAGRRCPRAPRPARTRRSSCATATRRAMAARACARRSTRSTARSSTRSSGLDAVDQLRIDRTLIELDGTPNKARLGANADPRRVASPSPRPRRRLELPLYRYVGGVFARTLPVPMMNIVNGGAHADNPIDFQEFMIMPVGAPSLCRGPAHGRRRSSTRCAEALHDAGHNTNVGDEGGFAPNLASADEALDFIMQAIERAGYQPGEDVVLALDPASTEFFKDGAYISKARASRSIAPAWSNIYAELVARYPIVSIEDGMAEDDWAGWSASDRRARRQASSWSATTCSSPTRAAAATASRKGVANAILVKVNQIGTLTETLEAVEIAHAGRLHAR